MENKIEEVVSEVLELKEKIAEKYSDYELLEMRDFLHKAVMKGQSEGKTMAFLLVASAYLIVDSILFAYHNTLGEDMDDFEDLDTGEYCGYEPEINQYGFEAPECRICDGICCGQLNNWVDVIVEDPLTQRLVICPHNYF